MTEKKNNWFEKSDKNSHHYNTSFNENIVQRFFMIPQKRLLAQKNVRFLVPLIPFKRGQKSDRFELSSSTIFLGVQGSLGW